MPGLQSQEDLTKLVRRYRDATKAQSGSAQRVQEVIDDLDEALEETQPCGALYGKGVTQLRSWCSKESGRIPSSCILAQDTVQRDTPDRPYSSSGMSHVYTGITQSGILVAVKSCNVERDAQEKAQQSFRNEVVTWKCLGRHPNIVPFLGIYSDLPVSMVSVWMPKGTISGFFLEKPRENRAPYIEQILRGLEFMHAFGVVHGDLKPVNILVDESQNARLVDFGMSTFLFKTSTQLANPDPKPGSVGGTVRYMAPELLSEECDGDALNFMTDIYALSITLWQLFAQQMPYANITRDFTVVDRVLKGHRPTRPAPASVDVGLTDEVWDVMQRGWQKEPGLRPKLGEFRRANMPEVLRLRELALDMRQALLNTREQMLEVKEVTRRETEVTLRETEATRLEKKVTDRETEAKRLEKKVKDRETEVKDRETEVTRREKEVTLLETEVMRRETEAMQKVTDREKEATRREKEATRRETEATRRERKVTDRETEVTRRETELAKTKDRKCVVQ